MQINFSHTKNKIKVYLWKDKAMGVMFDELIDADMESNTNNIVYVTQLWINKFICCV